MGKENRIKNPKQTEKFGKKCTRLVVVVVVGKQGDGAVRISSPVSQTATQGADALRSAQEVKLEELKPVYVPTTPQPAQDKK